MSVLIERACTAAFTRDSKQTSGLVMKTPPLIPVVSITQCLSDSTGTAASTTCPATTTPLVIDAITAAITKVAAGLVWRMFILFLGRDPEELLRAFTMYLSPDHILSRGKILNFRATDVPQPPSTRTQHPQAPNPGTTEWNQP